MVQVAAPVVVSYSVSDAAHTAAVCTGGGRHQTFQAVPDIGLLLAYHVIVGEEAPNCFVVGFLDPQITLNLVGAPEVKTVAGAAELRLRCVCESLGGAIPPGPPDVSCASHRRCRFIDW